MSGGAPKEDYANIGYRAHRAYMNLTEILPAFAAVAIAAMMVGASPFWVNLLAAVFFVSRVVMAVVHIGGYGKADGGLRSMIFTIGWACCIGLSIMVIWAVLG